MASLETRSQPPQPTTRVEQLQRSINGFKKLLNEDGSGLAPEVKARIDSSIRAKNPDDEPFVSAYIPFMQEKTLGKIWEKQSQYEGALRWIQAHPEPSGEITPAIKAFAKATGKTITSEELLEEDRRFREPVGEHPPKSISKIWWFKKYPRRSLISEIIAK